MDKALLPDLKRTLQSLRAAVHMLRDPNADANAAAFICAAAEKQLEEIVEGLDGAPPKGRRVLIADADKTWADALAETLRLEGHQTGTAASSADVLATCSAFRPDVVLADLGMTGQSAARNLRSVSEDAVLVALSTWSRESDVKLARELGWDHYVHKPVSPVELARLVSKLPPPGTPREPRAAPAAPIMPAFVREKASPRRRARR